MKFWGHNSLAMPADADGLLSKTTQVGKTILDSLQAQPQPGDACQAQPLDAMEKLGKQAAFEQRIKSHLEPLTGLAFRLTGDWDLAEEVVQETMLRAVRNWESFREQSQFKTWLYRILINALRDQVRNQEKIPVTAVEHIETESREQTVEAQVEANELNVIVSQLIAQLPQRQREVLVLTTYESLTSVEISKLLGISVDNVYSNLSTARKRLKQQLARYVNP